MYVGTHALGTHAQKAANTVVHMWGFIVAFLPQEDLADLEASYRQICKDFSQYAYAADAGLLAKDTLSVQAQHT